MMSEKKPRRQFDLRSDHLPDIGSHAVPARARDPELIRFRKSRRSGALVLDEQKKGIAIAGKMIELLASGEVDDGGFATEILAITGLNTAAYNNRRYRKETMARRLKLPQLVVEEDGEEVFRETESGLLLRARSGMTDALRDANDLAIAYDARHEGQATYLRLTKSLGNTSAILGLVRKVEDVQGMGAVDAQEEAKDKIMWLQEKGRTIAVTPYEYKTPMHEHPSMMQLPDPDSTFSVFWRTQAPNIPTAELLERAESEIIIEGLAPGPIR